MWNKILINSGCLTVLSIAAVAAPLDRAHISNEAKWVIHLDVEAMRNSALGTYVFEEMVKPAMEKAPEIKSANLSMNISNVTSITAYGPSLDQGAEGVLLVSTTADPRKDLDTIAGMFLVSAGTNSPFILQERDPYPLYTFSKAVFLAPFKNTLVVAKSKDQIERAHQVMIGKAANLTKSNSFQDLREVPKSFLSIAIAEGFAGNAGMPAQAQILKETTGGRICIGERDQNVFVNLVFQGKDDMATTRIQQVLQGIVALVSLSQEDKDITQLASSAKINADGRNVLVNIEYPVEKTIEKIKEGAAQKHQPHRPAKVKAKHKKRPDAKAQEQPSQPAEADEQPPSKELQNDDKATK